jgi:hypothetical protein
LEETDDGAPRASARVLPAGGLEQLYRIAVRILYLDLPATGTLLHLIAKAHPSVSEFSDARREVVHCKHKPVPTVWLLMTAVGHVARTGRPGITEDELEIADGNLPESAQVLLVKAKAQRFGIEVYGSLDIRDLTPDASKPECKTKVCFRNHHIL